MITIIAKYNIKDNVHINGLDCLPGRIQEIRITACGGSPEYLVEYWWEGQIKTVWLDEDEISIKGKDENGNC